MCETLQEGVECEEAPLPCRPGYTGGRVTAAVRSPRPGKGRGPGGGPAPREAGGASVPGLRASSADKDLPPSISRSLNYHFVNCLSPIIDKNLPLDVRHYSGEKCFSIFIMF